METKNLPSPKLHARSRPGGLLRTTCAMRWLVLLLLTLPAVVQAQFIYTTNNGTITITGYTGPGGVLAIPSTINSLPVTGIGRYTFFGALISPTSLSIPSSVTNIHVDAFTYSTDLEEFTVDPDNSNYGSMDGVLFNKSRTTLLRCPPRKTGNYIIPSSVANIEDHGFYRCTSLSSLTIPSSVTSIGLLAFAEWGNLTNLTIPDSVTSIGRGAFDGCTSLATITIPSGVTTIERLTFDHCTKLTSVMMGSGVTNIGDQAFGYCASLTNITIPRSVSSIGSVAFYGCNSLATITIPSGVSSLGWEVFRFCPNLSGVYFEGNAPSIDLSTFNGDNAATIYYLPGTTGWGATLGSRPTALWKPQVQSGAASFGVKTNQFRFNITWTSGRVIVVEGCTNLANPTWTPLQTNTLTGDSVYFSDPKWTNYTRRFYRIRSP